nr:MAG TPA: hypothetical protein [Caudoviricetes sp.]
MKGLDEIIEEFKNSEESKALDKVNEATKKLLSRKEVMEALAEVTAGTIEACFEEKNKSVATIRAGLEGYRLIEKLFPEEPAEKPAEKTELSDLKELLFERTHLAKEKYDNEHMDLQFSRYTGLYALIKDAELKEEYDAWKEEKGYE